MTENTQIALAMSGLRHPERFGKELNEEIDFYDIKGTIISWLENMGFAKWRFEPLENDPAFKKNAAGVFKVAGQPLIRIGQVAKQLTNGIRLRHPVFIAIVNLDDIMSTQKSMVKYKELPQFPGTARDITFIASPELTHQHIVDTILGMKLSLIKDVKLFDIFEDEKVLGAGKRSLSYSVYFQDDARTLTDDEINKLQDQIRNTLVKKLGVELK